MPNILICDDEKDIVDALKIYLSDPDFRLFEAGNGREALRVISENEIHLVLMDIMMPEMDGITAMSAIRQHSNVPVILLTAKSDDTDKILGLNVGADDYITKPFNPLEVTARVRSQLRRYLKLGAGTSTQQTYVAGGIELDDMGKKVTVDGEEISLTPKEFDILRLLMASPGRVFPPKEIYRSVWKEEPLNGDNTVAVHIRHLREKIEIDPAEPRYIKVVFGHGYKCEKERER
ncbi:MAG: response regulator transcription factor [Eubacteriaceae bacterium]|nr:response regulator transcription factor [Eubacteriaceae bacterium]